MKWLVIMDNPNEKYPRDWVLKEFYGFTEYLKEYTIVESMVFSENSFSGIEITYNKKDTQYTLINKKISSGPFDGVVVTMTRNGTNILVENEKVRKIFKDIINQLKKEGLIIFCTGESVFNQLKDTKIFQNLNIIFHNKIAIKWFNYLLRELVKSNIIK